MPSPSRFKDRVFYGWVVVATFFVVGITLYGIHLSFGVFFKSIESEFDLTRAATSSIVSINLILAGVFSFVAGWALDRYGPRRVVLLMGIFTGLSLALTSLTTSHWQLFITYSLLLSLGTGAVYVVPMSTVSRWFNKKRGLALGLAGSGLGLGMIIFAPLATYFITHFGWRTAYLVLGVIAWVLIIPLSRFLKGDPREIGALPDGVKSSRPQPVPVAGHAIQQIDSSLLRVVRTRNFPLLVFVWIFFAACAILVYTHLVPHVTDMGFSAAEAAAVFSALGVAALLGRAPVGVIADRIGRKLTASACTLLMAAAMLWLLWARELWMFYPFVLVFGFASTGYSTSIGALVGDVFSTAKIGAIFGMLEIGFGIGAAAGPALGGIVFDVTGSYSAAFLGGAVVMLIATLLIVLVREETDRNLESGQG